MDEDNSEMKYSPSEEARRGEEGRMGEEGRREEEAVDPLAMNQEVHRNIIKQIQERNIQLNQEQSSLKCFRIYLEIGIFESSQTHTNNF